MPHFLLAERARWEQPQLPEAQSEPNTTQYVSLVVWQMRVYKYNLALTAAYGTENCNQ
jgi:hypothetical protein